MQESSFDSVDAQSRQRKSVRKKSYIPKATGNLSPP